MITNGSACSLFANGEQFIDSDGELKCFYFVITAGQINIISYNIFKSRITRELPMTKQAYLVKHTLPETINEVIEQGLMPFSIIKACKDYLELKGVESLKLEQIRADMALNEYGESDVDLTEVFKGVDAHAIVVGLASFCREGLGHHLIEHSKLVETGLQVEIQLFKSSGKFAYEGVVSVGDARPWDDDFSQKVMDNQKVVSSSVDDYSVLIQDTVINQFDSNYMFCATMLHSL